jgi:hypothetical protein
LSIDNATCTISGVPTEVRALSVYTVTAKNATDDDSANFSLTLCIQYELSPQLECH